MEPIIGCLQNDPHGLDETVEGAVLMGLTIWVRRSQEGIGELLEEEDERELQREVALEERRESLVDDGGEDCARGGPFLAACAAVLKVFD